MDRYVPCFTKSELSGDGTSLSSLCSLIGNAYKLRSTHDSGHNATLSHDSEHHQTGLLIIRT